MSTRALSGKSRRKVERDVAIYCEVVVERLTQEEVARRYQLTQGRVSQIVARVRRGREEATPPEDEALAAARAARREERECRERREHYLTLAAEGYRQSSQPLVTTRTRERGGEVEFVEKTERQQRANVQFLKLMVKLNEEIGGERSESRGQRSVSRGEGVTGRRGEGESKGAASVVCEPETNNDPAARGMRKAIEELREVLNGSATLAEVESWNCVNSQTDGFEYPSYFEKCAESMNGVRVADWVRDHVPDDLLPHGDDVWLPYEHLLADFDVEGREIIEVDNSRRFFNPSKYGWRFGGRGQRSESRSHWEGEAPAEPRCAENSEGARGREGEGEMRHHDLASLSPSPTLPLSPDANTSQSAAAQQEPRPPKPEPAGTAHPTLLERLIASGRVRTTRERKRFELLIAARAKT